MLKATSRFRTKFILVAGIGVFIGLGASAAVALYGVTSLGQESTREVEQGLTSASREYLTNHLIDSALQIYEILGRASTDLEILASITQSFSDREAELAPLHRVARDLPSFADRLEHNAEGNWYTNDPKEPMAVAVWGYLLDQAEGAEGPAPIRADVRAEIDSTALLDLVVPPFQEKGASSLQVYYVGPEHAPYLRIAPWAPAAQGADKKYPGHNETPFWSFYFPGLVQSWQQWTTTEGGPDGRRTQVTVLPPYEDAGGGGLVTTFLHPIWEKDRKTFAGAVGIDMTLNQLVTYIKDLRIYESGFAFLAQSSGNVLAVNDAGERILGLHQGVNSKAGGGVDVLNRRLADSKKRGIAELQLPGNDRMVFKEIRIGDEDYVLVMRRLAPLEAWTGKVGISPEHWTLGMVVPAKEIFASVIGARESISASTQRIAGSQIAITFATLLMVLLGISVVSRRMTSALEGLTGAARRIMNKEYDVTVEVTTADEVGELGAAFNAMASEIRAYTSNLEGLVRQRTSELEDANQEISKLNDQLKEENVRLGAELEVARRLQLMVLPHERELSEIEGLDIAGFMEPADEVGGDYYDVLRAQGGVKIGIGDVTGHGLESGVLMIMLQAAVRTLVLAEERDPERFLNIVNKAVYQNIQRIGLDRSVTLSLLDYSDGALDMTGQHEEAIVVRADGTLERVDTMNLGLPVGLDFDIADFLGRTRVDLNPQDVVVLYTDGITEAENSEGEQYELDRLCEVVRANHKADAVAIKDAVMANVSAFIGSQKVFDDITLVVIKRTEDPAEEAA